MKSMTSSASPGVQDFVSYCRLVKCARESAGKRYGTSGNQDWQCRSAMGLLGSGRALFLRTNPAGQKYLARLEKNHGKGKALTILAHQLARAVYYMLKRHTAFDMATFLRG